jgi:hypothetical protein
VGITNAIASVAVKDLAKSVAWYRTLFGRVPDSTPIPAGVFLLFGDLRARLARLRQADCNGLLATFHLFAGSAAVQRAALHFMHGALNLPTTTTLFGCHVFSLRRLGFRLQFFFARGQLLT